MFVWIPRHGPGRLRLLQSQYLQHHQSQDGAATIAARKPEEAPAEEEHQQLQSRRPLWYCGR